MKFLVPSILLPALALYLSACDGHTIEETRHLHESHGAHDEHHDDHHGEEGHDAHGDHDDAHAKDVDHGHHGNDEVKARGAAHDTTDHHAKDADVADHNEKNHADKAHGDHHGKAKAANEAPSEKKRPRVVPDN